jgi:hypothetical protein
MGGMQAYRRRAAATERMVDAAVAEVKAEQHASWEAQKAARREAEATRRRFTRDDLVDALLVRDIYGWARVVRVNERTITVAADFGNRKIPFDRVLEFRGGAA